MKGSHWCSRECNIPDVNVRVSSLLDWIKSNTLDGVCVSESSFDQNPFLLFLYFNYVMIVLLICVKIIFFTWIPKELDRTFQNIYYILLISFMVVFNVEQVSDFATNTISHQRQQFSTIAYKFVTCNSNINNKSRTLNYFYFDLIKLKLQSIDCKYKFCCMKINLTLTSHIRLGQKSLGREVREGRI